MHGLLRALQDDRTDGDHGSAGDDCDEPQQLHLVVRGQLVVGRAVIGAGTGPRPPPAKLLRWGRLRLWPFGLRTHTSLVDTATGQPEGPKALGWAAPTSS